MRPLGFSTGALAYADFRRALGLLEGKPISALELSALRLDELLPLLDALDELDLKAFRYISVHAPSQFPAEAERWIVEALGGVALRGWPIILHPDTIHDHTLWRSLGALVCIENMDKRKPIGRTVRELEDVYGRLPDAGLCFDIGHAHQVDPTMTEACLILERFAGRLRQLHVSEVNTRSRHDPLSWVAIHDFRTAAPLIPDEIPLVIESIVSPEQIDAELDRVRRALPPRASRQAIAV